MNSFPQITKTEFWQQFAEALKRQSLLMFENLGIWIDIKTLPSWELYSLMREIRFGSGFCGRLWAKKLRPFIQPDKHNKICLAFTYIQGIHQQNLMDAIFERAKEVAP